MAKIKTASSSAIYGGVSVQLFKRDLSNYSQLRRGLSPSMRAETLTKEELLQASPDLVAAYIEALNAWRERGQAFKKERARNMKGVEELFKRAGGNVKYYSANERVKIATANLRLKAMTKNASRFAIQEALNQVDRAHAGAWYTPTEFYKAKYYLDNGTWDPGESSDEMLRSVVMTGAIEKFDDDIINKTVDEYMVRIGGGTDMASSNNAYRSDILGMAEVIISGL